MNIAHSTFQEDVMDQRDRPKWKRHGLFGARLVASTGAILEVVERHWFPTVFCLQSNRAQFETLTAAKRSVERRFLV